LVKVILKEICRYTQFIHNERRPTVIVFIGVCDDARNDASYKGNMLFITFIAPASQRMPYFNRLQ